MFGRIRKEDQPRGKLSNWLSRVFGKKKEEPTAEAFSLDGPETAEVEMRNQSRMTEKYQEYLREQEKKLAQEISAAEEKPEAVLDQVPAEEPAAAMPEKMTPEETISEETAPEEAETAISAETPSEETVPPETEEAPGDPTSDPDENA